MAILEFEKPLLELEAKIEELRNLSSGNGVNITEDVTRLQSKVNRMLVQIYARLTPYQKVQVARHPLRPQTSDYINELIEDFTPLAGDRMFAEDQAIIGGLGRFRGRSCVVMGHEKGRETNDRVRHNFGMARPEGYRKAQRLIQMASKFGLPVITFIDTAGAYPGIDAEARGQSEAIARSIQVCLQATVPVIATIIGEGGSGGAIAIATADRVLMLEHSIYSVISPEGCASILWRSASNANKAEASAALRLTSDDLSEFGIIDKVIKEPLGGAHRNAEQTIRAVGEAIENELYDLRSLDADALKQHRRQKYLDMGSNLEAAA